MGKKNDEITAKLNALILASSALHQENLDMLNIMLRLNLPPKNAEKTYEELKSAWDERFALAFGLSEGEDD